MLLVLYGATAYMGYCSRNYLANKGYEAIEKKTFYPDRFGVMTSHMRSTRYTRKDVADSDFVYETNGVMIGFDRNQIIDSVRGRKNTLLTISIQNSDFLMAFLKDIRATYGEYVNVVYAYLDSATGNETAAFSDISSEEYAARLEMNANIKQFFTENRELFDDVVIYGGRDSVFGLDFLYKQYDLILSRLQKKEKLLNSKMYVELPYSGSKPYLFVSYSHKDTQKVMPILSEMQRRGYRIWFDEGINCGDNWMKLISSKVENCKNFLCFISENSVTSTEVRAEVTGARLKKTPIINIRENDAAFPFDIEMYISQFHILSYPDEDLCAKLEQAIDPEIKES